MERKTENVLREALHGTDYEIDNDFLIRIQTAVRDQKQAMNQRDRNSFGQFFFRMTPYIFWKIWFVQGACLVFMCLGLLATAGWPKTCDASVVIKAMCMFAGMIPFIAVPFLYRSNRFGMQEIEMATYHSYTQQLVVKLGVIAVGDAAMLGSGIAIGVGVFHVDMLSALLYGILPFLCISSLLLFITTKISVDKAIATYTVCFLVVMVIEFRTIRMYPMLFSYRFNGVSFFICVALVLSIWVQLKNLIRNSMYQEMLLTSK